MKRPGYAVVAQQLQAPRETLRVHSVQLTPDRRTLLLVTDPHPAAVHYAVRLPWRSVDADADSAIVRQDPVVEASLEWPSGIVQRIDVARALAGELTIVEPRWIEVVPRVVPAGAIATLTYVALDDAGVPLGAAGAGRRVEVIPADAGAVPATDLGDGSYRIELPRPAATSSVRYTIRVDGVARRALMTCRTRVVRTP